MNYIFYNAHEFNQPISNWDVSNVTDMEEMFNYAKSFNQDISMWNVSKVIYYAKIFKNCHINLEYIPRKFKK